MDDVLALQAGTQWIAAANVADGPKRFSMEAYSGGTIRQAWSPDLIVIDLAGMQFKQQVPVVNSHRYEVGDVLGQTLSVRSDSVLHIEGEILADTDVAGAIKGLAAAGYQCQASVGADVHSLKRVAEGDSVTVNGRSFVGPLRVVTSSTLREVSFVVLGADAETAVRVAAQQRQESSMAETDSQPGVAATGPTGQASEYGPTGTDQGADKAASSRPSGDTAGPRDVVSERVIAALDRFEERLNKFETVGQVRASRPAGPAIHVQENTVNDPLVMEAALAIQGGLRNAETLYDDKTLQAANKCRRDVSLSEVFVSAARANGYTGSGSVRSALPAIIQAAFASHQISDLLSNLVNKFLLNGFNSVENVWQRIAAVRSVNDFKAINLLRLNGDLKFKKVGPAGELKVANVTDYKRTLSAETWGITTQVTRQDLYNDDLNALSMIPQRMGRGAALALNEAIWTEFAASNSTYYQSVTAASGNALSLTSLQAANTAYRRLTDPDGNPLGIRPAILLAPPGLQITAMTLNNGNQLVASGLASTSAKTLEPNVNVLAGMFEVVISNYLESVTGGSQTTWWLVADGADLPALDVAFLSGQQSPTIEQVLPEADKLGVTLRGYMDFGVTKGEPLSTLRMATS